MMALFLNTYMQHQNILEQTKKIFVLVVYIMHERQELHATFSNYISNLYSQCHINVDDIKIILWTFPKLTVWISSGYERYEKKWFQHW